MSASTPQAEQAAFRRRIRQGIKRLQAASQPLGVWMAEAGPCAWEVAWDRTPYESLVRAIAHQQLNGRAAATIFGRLEAGFRGHDFPTPRQLTRAAPAKLRAMGFSGAKVLAIQGIAAAAAQGEVPTREAAATMSDEELIAHLTQLRGVGKWTVEMLLMFTLGRLDVMPVDDFGVQSGLQHLFGLPERPKKAQFAEYTDVWRPYRSIAAWYMWRRADAAKK